MCDEDVEGPHPSGPEQIGAKGRLDAPGWKSRIDAVESGPDPTPPRRVFLRV